jgi:serine/threonine-protein kinase RsbW
MGHPQTTLLLRLCNGPEATRKLRAALSRVAESYDLSPEAAFELKLAATEALTNAIKGAADEHSVEVAITGSPEGVDVEVTDRGVFAPSQRQEHALDSEGGRGIPLMLALVDEVEFASVGDGTRVRMRKRASHSEARGTPVF